MKHTIWLVEQGEKCEIPCMKEGGMKEERLVPWFVGTEEREKRFHGFVERRGKKEDGSY